MTKKEGKRERPLSPKWITFRQVADHFQVSEATVRLGRGVFATLKRVPVGDKRVLIPRAEVERLDRALERAAVALDPS
jgi:hypothetical protein